MIPRKARLLSPTTDIEFDKRCGTQGLTRLMVLHREPYELVEDSGDGLSAHF